MRPFEAGRWRTRAVSAIDGSRDSSVALKLVGRGSHSAREACTVKRVMSDHQRRVPRGPKDSFTSPKRGLPLLSMNLCVVMLRKDSMAFDGLPRCGMKGQVIREHTDPP
jgi:hypothetical protein